MPFYSYKLLENSRGRTAFSKEEQVSLGGLNGPIAAFVKRTKGKENPYRWHMAEMDILNEMGKAAKCHALLVDLKPDARDAVSLYRITNIWGHSYEFWTPIMIRFEVICADQKHKSPGRFKANFSLKESNPEVVYEFLYFNGGVLRGNWNWGRTGSVNGAMLWSDALSYFINNLPKQGSLA